jgi:alpha-galactosidase
MDIRQLAQFVLGDTLAIYLLEAATGRVGLWLVPAEMASRVRRVSIDHVREQPVAIEHGQPLWSVDPLVHIHRTGDSPPGYFSQGRTLRNGSSTAALKFAGQQVESSPQQTTILTRLATADGLRAEHRLTWRAGTDAVRVETSVHNESLTPVTLDLLTSFSLGGITPFADDVAAGRLVVHRVRSSWASEGRLDSQTVEAMQLEPSFSRFSAAVERFGQVGTMPTRGFFPFVAVEDTEAGVTWGAQLAWAGSWQMELYRRDDTLSLSGGLADRELGHWQKALAPGEAFAAPTATLACVKGGLEALCHRLTDAQQHDADAHPATEKTLPIVFNEWCTSWGHPSHESVLRIADHLAVSPAKYFVIDAGWYDGHGDWRVNAKRFPDLKSTARALRDKGLVPGLWFEFENCSSTSQLYKRTEWMLHRDGHPIEVAGRRFLDFTRPDVRDYLAERVIGLLRDCDIGYLKIDYNETIGIGCDGAESLGEKLRQHVVEVGRFFNRIRLELPDLVIENCASGGHRLEPSLLAATAMSSFSDAHESIDIPIIAANLHRVMLPRQSQIWAVLRRTDTRKRLVYSLSATFLGRMCLSGDIADLDAAQAALCHEAMRLYGLAAPVIADGRSHRFGPPLTSYRKPASWQAVVRGGEDLVLVVAHSFARPQEISLPLPFRCQEVVSMLTRETGSPLRGDDAVHLSLQDWDAAVILLRRS